MTRGRTVSWALILVLAYVAVALVALRCRHPELSETQLLMHFWQAVTYS